MKKHPQVLFLAAVALLGALPWSRADEPFDANRTHDCINLPLARTADDSASMGHARALIYWATREARRKSPQPHRV
ncbi:MAG: hypothetical protein JO284_09490 [Planctomycetaceae bacterium]|nr:hypothetical protein [Planctomycetaceae bacterium]MBV8234005.1 hypothetical protein [Planctomycetaceae bacterium]MBV8270063.1 hypothetical protein [Planctomycetaceae bacterium]